MLVSGFSGDGKRKASPAWQSKQTLDNHPMLFQCRASVKDVEPTLKQYWVNGTCLLGWCGAVYSRPSVGVVLGQCRIQFVSIEPAMGCDNIDPTLN